MHSCGRLQLLWDVKSNESGPDQLLCIAEATGSKIYTTDLVAKIHGRMKTLVLLLRQCHAHYYWFYEKGTTRAMVGLQGLHTSNAFQCSNMSASVGLRSFCPWCFKLGGNTETIATHLREVHYWLAITCDVYKAFASISVQIILKHHVQGVRSSCTKRSPRWKTRQNAS